MKNSKEELKKISILIESRKYEDALNIVDLLILEHPEWFQPYYEKAKIYARGKSWSKAIEFIDKAIQLKKNEPMLSFSRARWLLQGQLFCEAIEELTQLIALEEKLNDTYYLESSYFFRALASSYLGNYKDVITDCTNVRDDYSMYILNKPHSKDSLVRLAVDRLG